MPETAPPGVHECADPYGPDGRVVTLSDSPAGKQLAAATGQNAVVGNPAQLQRECESYTRYLVGQLPDRYMVEKYRDFHQKMGVTANEDRFGCFLLATSARGPLWARLVDSYASVWRKASSVRKKLILTLALIECSPPGFEKLDRCPAGGLPGATLRLGLGALGYACFLFAATALFAPIYLWMAMKER